MSEPTNIRQIPLVPQPAKQEVIDYLRELLVDAEKGEVLAMVVVSVRLGQEVRIYNGMQTPDEAFRLVGALEMSKRQVMDRIEFDFEETEGG